MAGELVEQGATEEDAVAADDSRAQGILGLADCLEDLVADVGGASAERQADGLLGDAELGIEVVDHRRAVSVEDQALDGADAVKLDGGIQVAVHARQALVDQILRALHFGFATEGAQVLDGVRQQGVVLLQVRNHEGTQVTAVASLRTYRFAALAHRHQGQTALVVLDGHGGGGDTFLAEQAQRADAARLVGLLVDGGGQAGNAESVVVENVEMHGFLLCQARCNASA
ncbi:hypothetical protein FQZ97_709250 [compost metagenome]